MRQFQIVHGEFAPKNRATLKPEASQYIGLVSDWVAAWLIDDEDSGEYAGQFAMTLRDPFVAPKLGWIPECDLKVVDSLSVASP